MFHTIYPNQFPLSSILIVISVERSPLTFDFRFTATFSFLNFPSLFFFDFIFSSPFTKKMPRVPFFPGLLARHIEKMGRLDSVYYYPS